jgi:hypothetical protein
MRSRTIAAALAAPLMAAGTLALTAGSASASTWQDTSIQVTHSYTEDTYPAAPATAATSLGTITVAHAAAGGLLSVNRQASSLPGSVTAVGSGTVITLSGSIVSPPPTGPVTGTLVVNVDRDEPFHASLAQIIRFSENPVTGRLTLGSVYTDAPIPITYANVTGGAQFAEPYVLTGPAGAVGLAPAPAYRFDFPGLPQEIVHSPAGRLTAAGSTAAPGAYGTLGVIATDQYGAHTGSLYDMVIQGRQVNLPGNYGDEVNQFGNGFDVYRQHQAVNTMIIGWPATKADPGTHFIREAGTIRGAYRFEYAPYGKPTGLYVADPGYDAAGTGLRHGLVLRAANNGPWQQWYPMSDGTLNNAATFMIITPNGTGAQLRGTVPRASMPAGSAYTWTDYAHLPR